MTNSLELSRVINVAETLSSPNPVNLSIKASSDELNALAKRFDLVNISLLEAEIKLSAIDSAADRDTDVLAEVKLRANLTQTCSVTTEPINDEIDVVFSQIFSTTTELPADSGGDSFENDDFSENNEFFDSEASTEDVPEPIINGVVDMGEFISQELSLRIDPFPRKKGVEFEWVNKNNDDTEALNNPFAKLSALKNSLNDKK